MAKASWCTVNPMSGSGTRAIAISGSAHTGRSNRTTTVTVTNANGTKPSKTIAVTQTKAPLSNVKVTAGTSTAVAATGGDITFKGTSNARSIQVTLGGTGGTRTIKSVVVDGVAQTAISGAAGYYAITGDPGSIAAYTYAIVVTVGAITAPTSKTITCTVAAAVGDTKTEIDAETTVDVSFSVTQNAAASTITVAPTSLTLVTAGTAQNVTVTSNDSWTVS